MKTRWIALVSFAGISAISAAAVAGQPVRGRVTDANTIAPIEGATVQIEGRPGKVTSNAEGLFKLPNVPPGTWTLQVSKPPFTATTETVVVEADHPPELVEMLLVGEMATLKLVEPMKPHPNPPGGVDVVREEIQRIAGTRGDVLTSIQSLPGVANTGTFTPFSSGIIIRGSDPSDARILVDGFEIPLLYHFGAVQSIIPTEMIDGISYQPGGFGVENGRASSGVVEVHSRAGTEKLGGFAELSFINGAVMLHGPIGNPSNHATFAVSFRRSVVDAIVPAVLGKDSGLAFSVLPRYYDWQARADWAPSDHWKLALFFFGTDDRTAFALTPKTDTGDPLLSGDIGTRTDFDRAIASASYEGEHFKNRLAASLDVTRFTFDMSTDRHLHLHNRGLSFRDEAQWTVTPWLSLRGGAESITQVADLDERMPRPQREGDPNQISFTYDPIVTRQQTVTLPTVAAWTSADFQLGRHVQLVSGLRYDGFLRNNAHLVQPRGELKVFAGKNTFRLSGGLYSRPPYWEDEIAQASLKPEKAWQTAVGWERELLPGLTIQTTGFVTRRSDLIMFGGQTRETAVGQDVYSNAGTGQTYGGELMLTTRGPHHFGWLAYTLARSTRRDGAGAPERLFDFDQTHNLVLVGSRRFGKDDRWSIGGRFQFTTGKPYTPVLGATYLTDSGRYEPQWGAVNSKRLAPMHELDLRLDRIWSFKDWRLSAYVDVQNVYHHASVVDYRYNNDYTQKTAITTLPILPSIGVRAEF